MAFEHIGRLVTAYGNLGDLKHVGNIHPIARDLISVEFDLKMLFAGDLLNRKVCDAANIGHGGLNIFGRLVQGLLVFAKNLHGDLSINPRDEFVIAGLDDLRKVELNAGKAFHTTAHGINQLVFGLCGRPLSFRFQTNVYFVVTYALWIAAQICPPYFGHDGFNFGKLQQRLFNLR